MDKIREFNEWDENSAEKIDEENLNQFFSELPVRADKEEWLNTWSHGFFAILAIFALIYVVFCALESNKVYALESALVYGGSLVILFAASAFYHGVSTPLMKKRLRIMDHCAIFIFIAGNYTPLFLLTVGGSIGGSLLLIQWSVAIIGILLKIKFTGWSTSRRSLIYYITYRRI